MDLGIERKGLSSLAILHSPEGQRQFSLEVGQVIVVGRGPECDIQVALDKQLSRRHFSLEMREDDSILEDLDSTRGTLLNGRTVGRAKLRNGDQIIAGQTTFIFRTNLDQTLFLREEVSSLLELLNGSNKPLYALLDAARSRRILELLDDSSERYVSLYEGAQGQALADYAPYLLELHPGSVLLLGLIEEGWGRSWGICFECGIDFADLRKHLRRFLLVNDGRGDQFYFRFYDPRVLRTFLSASTLDERIEFFGPIQRFFLEDNDSSYLLTLFPDGRANRRKVNPPVRHPAGE